MYFAIIIKYMSEVILAAALRASECFTSFPTPTFSNLDFLFALSFKFNTLGTSYTFNTGFAKLLFGNWFNHEFKRFLYGLLNFTPFFLLQFRLWLLLRFLNIITNFFSFLNFDLFWLIFLFNQIIFLGLFNFIIFIILLLR